MFHLNPFIRRVSAPSPPVPPALPGVSATWNSCLLPPHQLRSCLFSVPFPSCSINRVDASQFQPSWLEIICKCPSTLYQLYPPHHLIISEEARPGGEIGTTAKRPAKSRSSDPRNHYCLIPAILKWHRYIHIYIHTQNTSFLNRQIARSLRDGIACRSVNQSGPPFPAPRTPCPGLICGARCPRGLSSSTTLRPHPGCPSPFDVACWNWHCDTWSSKPPRLLRSRHPTLSKESLDGWMDVRRSRSHLHLDRSRPDSVPGRRPIMEAPRWRIWMEADVHTSRVDSRMLNREICSRACCRRPIGMDTSPRSAQPRFRCKIRYITFHPFGDAVVALQQRPSGLERLRLPLHPTHLGDPRVVIPIYLPLSRYTRSDASAQHPDWPWTRRPAGGRVGRQEMRFSEQARPWTEQGGRLEKRRYSTEGRWHACRRMRFSWSSCVDDIGD